MPFAGQRTPGVAPEAGSSTFMCNYQKATCQHARVFSCNTPASAGGPARHHSAYGTGIAPPEAEWATSDLVLDRIRSGLCRGFKLLAWHPIRQGKRVDTANLTAQLASTDVNPDATLKPVRDLLKCVELNDLG